MIRPLPTLLLAAAVLCGSPSLAGEPGPGLEIINPDGTVNAVPAPAGPPPGAPYYPPAATAVPGQPYAAPNYQRQPQPTWESAEPFPPGASAPAGTQPPDFAGPSEAEATVLALDGDNRNYRGLAAAKAQRNLRGAADIIWRTLRERRIVYLALERGPGATTGFSPPYALQTFQETVNAGALPGPTAPLAAARRVDAVIDSFELPVIEDYGYGGMMDQILTRLHSDIQTVRRGMDQTSEPAVYHELARAYLRAAIVCDFFILPRGGLAAEVNAVVANAADMFHPDGSSVGGDVGGASGSVFHDLLLVDALAKNDRDFERSVFNTWSALEIPSRYLLSLALPDGNLPRFGPSGARELGPVEVARLREIYESATAPRRRPGLAASASFPGISGAPSYGGIYASRSGLEPGSRYLAVRFGPLGHLAGAPEHHDFGSLVLSAHNIVFMTDPGGFGGRAAEAGAHSALSLNGAFVLPKPCLAETDPVEAAWRTNSAIDYAADAAMFQDGKAWQRQILYVKSLPGEAAGDYWLVLDRVTMNGDPRPQAARIRFRLAPGITAYQDGSGMLAASYFGNGPGLRIYPIDQGSRLSTAEGEMGVEPSFVYDSAGGALSAPSVILDRTLAGDATTATILYPVADSTRRPARIVRDQDIIQGRPGAIVIDHGLDQIDVVAWAPRGQSLVTPTLNLQLSADAALFRLRRGKIVRMAFVGLEYFQAKEPDGGEWSLRVRGEPATLFFEPEAHGGWQALSDAANSMVTLDNVNLGPAIGGRRFAIAPGQTLIVPR
ncbi:MAG: heparinase II/III-family protein [Planctomycetota bacterium]|jgi:hypothetical protein|nr:heparinase II/III-family protein [Planctomycetota bacterium]